MTGKKQILLSFFRIIVRLIFINSGFSKVIDSNGFIRKMFEFGFDSFSCIAPLLSAFEIFLVTNKSNLDTKWQELCSNLRV